MPCNRCEACSGKRQQQYENQLHNSNRRLRHHRRPASAASARTGGGGGGVVITVSSSPNCGGRLNLQHQQQQQQQSHQQHQQQQTQQKDLCMRVRTDSVAPPCPSPNKYVNYVQTKMHGGPQERQPMPLFHNPVSPKRKYESSLTLGPVNINTKAMLRRSMEKLPVHAQQPNGEFAEEHLWTNPELRACSPLSHRTKSSNEKGVGNVRWWREHVPFSLPYAPEVADYDPNWTNSAVQRVVSDRGVTVHKLPTYAPQFWDPSAAPSLGEPTTLAAHRSWSVEERAARSVGSIRAPVGVALRCNHFLGDEAHVHPTASLAGKCVSGQTVSALLSLARPKTISRGCERGANGLSLAKHSFSHEQTATRTFPGVYPNIGVR